MTVDFKVVTLSHKNAPVDVREIYALEESGIKNLLLKIKEVTAASELLILSTCNRTEVYYSSPEDCSEEITKLLSFEKGVTTDYKQYFTSITDPDEAIQHLFNVSIGLEAQVVGDMQITNQVKTAYQYSADLNMAGPFLHRLMHTIFFTNKRVVQETPFRDGAASVSYATAELADELGAEIINPKVLVIGLGEMGADVCKNLLNSDIDSITVTNRTLSKVQELAKGTRINILPFEDLWKGIDEADIIVTSISRQEPLITKQEVAKLNLHSFKYFIDISVPRNIENSVEEIPGALLYNIDHINNRADKALKRRVAAIPDVEAIIKESIYEFNNWSKEMELSPTIQKLKNALEQIRQEEITRYMKQLDEDETKKVEMITRTMMQKIIKLPVLQLKAACKRGEAETLIDVLNDLFNLEKEEKKKTKA